MTTPDQDTQDLASDRTEKLDDPQPESHLATQNPPFAAHCNPSVIVDQEENPAQTAGTSGPDNVLISAKASSSVGGDGVEPGPSAEGISPATCHGNSRPKRTIRPPDRYGDWELNTLTSSGYPLIFRNKLATFKTFVQQERNRALRFKSDYMRKVQQLRK